MFQKWILSPTDENHIDFKILRIKFFNLIKTEKNKLVWTLRSNPLPKKIYATPKSKTPQGGSSLCATGVDAFNQYIDKIGSVLAEGVNSIESNSEINRVRGTVFATPTDREEVVKTLKQLKNKKVLVMMETQMKY